MKKIALIGLIILSFCAITSFSQPRIDIAVDIPFYLGIQLIDPTTGNSISGGDFLKYAFVLPELEASYVFRLGLVNLGLGIRMFTALIETIGWPNAFVEINLDPIVLSAEVGGGAFFAFGFVSSFNTGALLFGDISAAFKVADWFRAGVGVFSLQSFDPNVMFAQNGVWPFAVYAFGKFSIDLAPKSSD
jgi:hypothetical protein